jgi:hypothetical protein
MQTQYLANRRPIAASRAEDFTVGEPTFGEQAYFGILRSGKHGRILCVAD